MARTPVCDNSSGLRKGTWTPEEDRKLVAYVTRYGTWNWRQLPKFAGLQRCGKSCRLRWLNYLRPDLKRGNFHKDEDEIITRLHATLGNKWSAIATELPGRTDNEIKNHWHTCLKKKKKKKITKLEKEMPVKLSENSEIKISDEAAVTAPVLESSTVSPQPSSSTGDPSSATITSSSNSSVSSLFDLDPLTPDIWDNGTNLMIFPELLQDDLTVNDIPFMDFTTSQLSPDQASSSSTDHQAALQPSPDYGSVTSDSAALDHQYYSTIPAVPTASLLELEEAVRLDHHGIWTEAVAADSFSYNDFPAADLFMDLDSYDPHDEPTADNFFAQDSLFATLLL